MHNLHGIINSESRVGVQVLWVFSLVFLIATTHFPYPQSNVVVIQKTCTAQNVPALPGPSIYLHTGKASFSLLPQSTLTHPSNFIQV